MALRINREIYFSKEEIIELLKGKKIYFKTGELASNSITPQNLTKKNENTLINKFKNYRKGIFTQKEQEFIEEDSYLQFLKKNLKYRQINKYKFTGNSKDKKTNRPIWIYNENFLDMVLTFWGYRVYTETKEELLENLNKSIPTKKELSNLIENYIESQISKDEPPEIENLIDAIYYRQKKIKRKSLKVIQYLENELKEKNKKIDHLNEVQNQLEKKEKAIYNALHHGEFTTIQGLLDYIDLLLNYGY